MQEWEEVKQEWKENNQEKNKYKWKEYELEENKQEGRRSAEEQVGVGGEQAVGETT